MHYERIGPTLCDQQMHESFALKQKYLDPKAKKSGSGSSKSSKNSGSGSASSNSNSAGGGGGSAERKQATDSHASNTQSVRISFLFSRPYSILLDDSLTLSSTSSSFRSSPAPPTNPNSSPFLFLLSYSHLHYSLSPPFSFPNAPVPLSAIPPSRWIIIDLPRRSLPIRPPLAVAAAGP